jgi:hypothetical protein
MQFSYRLEAKLGAKIAWCWKKFVAIAIYFAIVASNQNELSGSTVVIFHFNSYGSIA